MRNLKDEIAAGHERANEIAEVMSKPIGMRHGVNKVNTLQNTKCK